MVGISVCVLRAGVVFSESGTRAIYVWSLEDMERVRRGSTFGEMLKDRKYTLDHRDVQHSVHVCMGLEGLNVVCSVRGLVMTELFFFACGNG